MKRDIYFDEEGVNPVKVLASSGSVSETLQKSPTSTSLRRKIKSNRQNGYPFYESFGQVGHAKN